MFDRYLPLTKVFNVAWLSRRHQFSSIMDSNVAARMVYPTHIMLELHLFQNNTSWNLSVMGYIYKNSCDEVWKNMIPGDGRSPNSLMGMPPMRLHDAYSTFTNLFCSAPPPGVFYQIFLDSSSWILLPPIWALYVRSIHCFPNSDLFLHNNWRWFGQGLFRGFVHPILFYLHHPQFFHAVLT